MTHPAPLEQARERVVLELSSHFAQDRLPIEELDRRLELAYASSSIAELEGLVADLHPAPYRGDAPAAAAPPDATRYSPAPRPRPYLDDVAERRARRLVAVMAETKRTGAWVVPPRMDVVAVMSDLVIDLRDAVLTATETEIELKAVMASVKIHIPPGMRVIDESTAVMSTVKCEDDPLDYGVPVLRLTGWSAMAEVTIKTPAEKKASRWW